MINTFYKGNMQGWFSMEVRNPVFLVFEYSDTNWTGTQQQTENLMSISDMQPQSTINALLLPSHEELERKKKKF